MSKPIQKSAKVCYSIAQRLGIHGLPKIIN